MSGYASIDINGRFRSDLEQTLTHWWQEILGVQNVEPDQDFFSLGGDPVLGLQLLAKIKGQYDIDLGIPALFDG